MSDIDPTPANVRAARMAAGLTQKACGERFGYSLPGWQKKETATATGRRLSLGEYEMLLLLAGEHPDFVLLDRHSEGGATALADHYAQAPAGGRNGRPKPAPVGPSTSPEEEQKP